jgi:hypothetical protein
MTVSAPVVALVRLCRKIDDWLLYWYDSIEPFIVCGLSFPLLYPLCLFLDWRDRRRGMTWPSQRKETWQ